MSFNYKGELNMSNEKKNIENSKNKEKDKKELLLDVKELKMYFPVYGGVFSRQVATVKAVDGVSFFVHKGETIGLVGESGCGKTTVGRCIIGLYQPTSGSIMFHGRYGVYDLAKLNRKQFKPFRSDIQMIFQDPYASLNPRMSIMDIVKEPLDNFNPDMSEQEKKEKVLWLLNKCGMRKEQAQRYPHEFSGGQRQRVGIARALATNPKLIVADEPVSALDVSIQAQVINLLMELQEEFGLTYIFIAHDLAVVKHISTRIAVMYLGNVVEIGPADDVYFNPLHPYSKALLSSVPYPDPEKKIKKMIALEGDVPTPLNKPSGCGFRTRCRIAKPDCAENIPQLVEVEDNHFVACPYFKA